MGLVVRHHKRLKGNDYTERLGQGGLQQLGFWRQADKTAGHAKGAQETGADRQQDHGGLDCPDREHEAG